MTTVGLLFLSFYRESGYYILACFFLISAPAVYYTTSNLAIVGFFPKISGFLLILIPSMFDMSTGLFLLLKLAYETLKYDLVTMLQILTASTSIVWLRSQKFCQSFLHYFKIFRRLNFRQKANNSAFFGT